MRKLYLIAYDDLIKRDDLTKYLESADGCGPWFYSIPNTVFTFSRMTAPQLYEVVHNAFPSHGRVFVTEVPCRNAEGWIPGSHWDLIRANEVVHEYDLDFKGYWVEGKESLLPAQAGIYCVYACVLNSTANTVALNRLLYIGRSDNIRTRHVEHESKPKWRRQLANGELLCYSAAICSSQSVEICEAAMIRQHKPACNELGRLSFNHGATRVRTRGCNALLNNEFIVK